MRFFPLTLILFWVFSHGCAGPEASSDARVDASDTSPAADAAADSPPAIRDASGDAPADGGSTADSAAADGGALPDAASDAGPALIACPTPLPSGWVFCDDFETGDLTHREGGARWDGPGPGASVDTSGAVSGAYSLALSYGGVADGADAFTEQRFELGTGARELWIRYSMYVPANYQHRSQSHLGESANNKGFIHLWHGDYGSGPGVAAGFEFWPMGGGAESVTTFHPFRPDIGHLEPTAGRRLGISASDVGQWATITIHLRAASVANNDGVAEVWRRPTGAAAELVYQRTDVPMYASPDTFERGYLLGWANSGFTETTVFRVDDVVFATSALTP